MNVWRVIPAVAALAMTVTVTAQEGPYDRPSELEGVDVRDRIGMKLPLDATFTNHDGETVTIGDYFVPGRPVILTPVFYECPQLCTLVLNDLAATMNNADVEPGADFHIVTFSFNPDETYELAKVKRQAYLTQYRHENADDGWSFLVGEYDQITRLCESIGFTYNKLDDGSYGHAAMTVIVAPDGTITHYLPELRHESRDMELALADSSGGVVGSPLDRFFLISCFVYDPDSGSFVPAAWKIMRTGGVLTIIAIVIGVAVLALKGPRRKATVDPELGGLQT